MGIIGRIAWALLAMWVVLFIACIADGQLFLAVVAFVFAILTATLGLREEEW